MSEADAATDEASATGRGDVRIGISGWRYASWRGGFYPAGLRQRDELAYASRQLDTIEINGTFYALQRPQSFARWHDETPEGFVFAVKGSRFITHLKQLHDITVPLANFLASGVLRLGDKLGPLLWQFPARLRFDAARIEAFLVALPRSADEAAALAAHHDRRLDGRAWTEAESGRTLRHAVEVRHPSFLDPAFVRLLRRHRVALVFADAVDWPYAEDLTADFVYLRLHGSQELYASGYSGAALDRWAERIAVWRAGGQPGDAKLVNPGAPPAPGARDIYVYFDNDARGRAPFDAQALRHRVPGR